MTEINVNNFEDVMYNLIQEYTQRYANKPVKDFLERVGDVFDLRTHKWSVFPNEDAPIGDMSEYTVFTDNGYEIFEITLNSYDYIGHVECMYDTLKAELGFKEPKKVAILFVEYSDFEELERLKTDRLTVACYDELSLKDGKQLKEEVQEILGENF